MTIKFQSTEIMRTSFSFVFLTPPLLQFQRWSHRCASVYSPIKSCKMYFLLKMASKGLTTVYVLCSTLLLDILEILILNGNIHLVLANNQFSSIFGEKKEALTTLFPLYLALCSFCISLLFVFPLYAEDIPFHVC